MEGLLRLIREFDESDTPEGSVAEVNRVSNRIYDYDYAALREYFAKNATMERWLCDEPAGPLRTFEKESAANYYRVVVGGGKGFALAAYLYRTK